MDSEVTKELTVDFLKSISVAKALGVILLVSAGAFLFLVWLIYFRETAEETASWVANLPALKPRFLQVRDNVRRLQLSCARLTICLYITFCINIMNLLSS